MPLRHEVRSCGKRRDYTIWMCEVVREPKNGDQPGFGALGFHYVRERLDAGENAAKLGKVANLHHEVQVGKAAADLDAHVHNVDTFTIQKGGDISHQTLPVIGLDLDRDGESTHILAPETLTNLSWSRMRRMLGQSWRWMVAPCPRVI